MRGYKDFIVNVPEKYSESYTTKGGLKLYADRHWSVKRVANTIVKVEEVPLNYDGPIKKRGFLFVDPTLLMQQSYVKGGEQENINLIDRDKKLYKVDPSLILMYLDENEEWKALGANIFLERIEKQKEESATSSLIILPESKTEFEKNKGIVAYANENILASGLNVGDIALFDPIYVVDIWLGDKEYMWVRNRNVYAVEVQEPSFA